MRGDNNERLTILSKDEKTALCARDRWSGDYNIPEIGAEEAVKVH